MSSEPDCQAAEVVFFWTEAGPKKWFEKDEALDRAIAERFAVLHGRAAAGELDRWAAHPDGALALLLLLDQFSRNLHRGSAQAFAQDAKAQDLARLALEAGFD